MITSSPNPEAEGQAKVKAAQEGHPVERQFHNMGERFNTMAQRLRGSLHLLQQDYPNINLDSDGAAFDAQEENLARLGVVTARRLMVELQPIAQDAEQPVRLQQYRPETSPHERLAEQEARVMALLGERQDLRADGLFEGTMNDRKYRQKHIRHWLEKQSPKEKFARQYLLKGLEHAGIQQSGQLLSIIERHISMNSYFGIKRGDLVRLVRHLDSQDEAEALRKLTVALDRLEQMHLFVFSDDLRNPAFADVVSTTEAIPQETFRRVFDDLSKYPFLRTNISITINDQQLSADTSALMEILKNGGLTEEHRQHLDEENLYARIGGAIPIVQKGQKSFPFSLDLTEALRPGENRMQEFRPFLIDAASKKLEERAQDWEQYTWLTTPDLLDGLEYLRREGKLALVKSFLDSGWSCQGIYREIGANAVPAEAGAIVDELQKAVRFFADEGKVRWVQKCQEALGGTMQLDPTALDYLEGLYANKETVDGVIEFLGALPKQEGTNLSDIIRISKRQGDEPYGIKVNYRALADQLQEVVRDEAIPMKDKRYASLIIYILNQTPGRHDAGHIYLQILPEDLPFFGQIARYKDSLNQYTNDFGWPTARFVEQVTGDHLPDSVVAKSFIRACIDPKNFSPAFGWKHAGLLTRAIGVDVITNLPEEFIHTLTQDEQNTIMLMKRLPLTLQTLLMEHRDNAHELTTQDGMPTVSFFELAVLNDRAIDTSVLTDEVLATLPEETRLFWGFLRTKSLDFNRFLVEKVSEISFPAVYAQNREEGWARRMEREFLHEAIITPARIGTWETLTDVFRDLAAATDKEGRALALLRVAEALRSAPLAGRTGVEATQGLREAFAALYRSDMEGLEKTAWNLLRKELPFTTDQQLMGEMRSQAVFVEQYHQTDLSWVHQAVHNYVRITTPDYIRNFRLWLETGEDQYFNQLQQLSQKYPHEAQIPGDLGSKRELFQDALGDIKKLEELTSLFYEVRPEKLASAIRDARALLQSNPKFLSQIEELAVLIQRANEHESGKAFREAAKLYGQFLIKTPFIREKLLGLAGLQSDRKDHLLVLDSVLSDMFKKSLPIYTDTMVRPRLAAGNLTIEEGSEFMQVFNSTLLSAILEGEDVTGGLKGSIFKAFEDPRYVSNALIHRSRLVLEWMNNSLNEGWGRFMSIAQPEMVAMLERIGTPRDEAIRRVYDTDLIAFRKSSYSFYLEDLTEVASSVLARLELIAPQPSEISLALPVQAMDIPTNIDEKVRAYIQGKIKSIPGEVSLEQAHNLFSQLLKSNEVQAEKLCRWLIKGYIDKQSLERVVTTVREEDSTITFYPYMFYGIDAVVITLNGEIIPDPLRFIRERYKGKMVPAMERSLREGD